MWPGKKMPGRMGGVRRTVQSVLVYKVIIPLACACCASRVHGNQDPEVLSAVIPEELEL